MAYIIHAEVSKLVHGLLPPQPSVRHRKPKLHSKGQDTKDASAHLLQNCNFWRGEGCYKHCAHETCENKWARVSTISNKEPVFAANSIGSARQSATCPSAKTQTKGSSHSQIAVLLESKVVLARLLAEALGVRGKQWRRRLRSALLGLQSLVSGV
jgi:hypothetical protein